MTSNKKGVLEREVESVREGGASNAFRDWVVAQVDGWFEREGVKRVKRGMYSKPDGKTYKLESLTRDFIMTHVHLIDKKSPTNRTLLTDAVHKYMEDLDDAEFKALRELIAYDSSIGDGKSNENSLGFLLSNT
jgi:hypothetical protein